MTGSELPANLSQAPRDGIEQALSAYIRLPAKVDLHLLPDGISVETSDFPALICEAAGFDFKQYFVDALKDADFLTKAQMEKLVADLMQVVQRVHRFACDHTGIKLQLSSEFDVPLPTTMTHGMIENVHFDRTVMFKLHATTLNEAKLMEIDGITFDSRKRSIALRELDLKAENSMCKIKARLNEHSCFLPNKRSGLSFKKITNNMKEWLMTNAIKDRDIGTELPVVMSDFQDCLRDAIKVNRLVQEPAKDLLSFIQRMGEFPIGDPFTKALLQGGNHILKEDDLVAIDKSAATYCDFGGIGLNISHRLHCLVARLPKELKISQLSGIDVRIPFDTPDEIKALGVDLDKSLPKQLTALTLSEADSAQIRKLTIGIGAGRWLAMDLYAHNFTPAIDADGNWQIYGFISNPISGEKQPILLRLDRNNNVNMTAEEYAELLTQTALHGFDAADPSTWKWGALAIGGNSIISTVQSARAMVNAVNDELDKAKKAATDQARKFGRLIGWLTKD